MFCRRHQTIQFSVSQCCRRFTTWKHFNLKRRRGNDICSYLIISNSFAWPCLFGRGPKVGPSFIMTDDADSERNAILNNWPAVVLSLYVFHLLQAYWRWLRNADNKIAKMDRPTVFNLFKLVVYAPNEELYKEKQEGLLNYATVAKYPRLLKHVREDIQPRKEEWSLTTRFEKNYSTHNLNTTNYVEVSFRITKENRFNLVKAFNLADLLDIILDDSDHYVKRCIDIGNNRTAELQNQKSCYLHKKCNIVDKIIVPEKGLPNSFPVPSETVNGKNYEVNMDLGLCECPMGILPGTCKHKHAVAANFDVVLLISFRQVVHYLKDRNICEQKYLRH